MFRAFLYGFLGFIIFGMAGIVIASQVYSDDLSTSFNILAGEITLAGTIASVVFARWMGKSGSTKLTSFSAHPKIDWGILGAILGGFGSMRLAQYLDPTYSARLIDLVGILIGVVVSAIVLTYTARWLNLPSFMKTTIDSPKDLLR